MTDDYSIDKRRYLRYEILDYALVFPGQDPAPVQAVIVDIGLGGLQIRSKAALPVGVKCSVEVGRQQRASLFLKGEIRHCGVMDNSDLFGSGIRFLPQDHPDRMAIAEYVHEIFQRQCEKLVS